MPCWLLLHFSDLRPVAMVKLFISCTNHFLIFHLKQKFNFSHTGKILILLYALVLHIQLQGEANVPLSPFLVFSHSVISELGNLFSESHAAHEMRQCKASSSCWTLDPWAANPVPSGGTGEVSRIPLGPNQASVLWVEHRLYGHVFSQGLGLSNFCRLPAPQGYRKLETALTPFAQENEKNRATIIQATGQEL